MTRARRMIIFDVAFAVATMLGLAALREDSALFAGHSLGELRSVQMTTFVVWLLLFGILLAYTFDVIGDHVRRRRSLAEHISAAKAEVGSGALNTALGIAVLIFHLTAPIEGHLVSPMCGRHFYPPGFLGVPWAAPSFLLLAVVFLVSGLAILVSGAVKYLRRSAELACVSGECGHARGTPEAE